MEKHYSTEEVSEILGISTYTIREYIRNGSLKGFKIGREWRISESDLQEFLDSKRNDTE